LYSSELESYVSRALLSARLVNVVFFEMNDVSIA